MAEVRVVRSSELSEATAQTPGMRRVAAIDRDICGSERLWVGVVTVEPGTSTGAHHHGETDSVVCVTEGRITIRWGERRNMRRRRGRETSSSSRQTVVHQEVNESDSEAVDSIVIRSGDDVVVNVVSPEQLAEAERGD